MAEEGGVPEGELYAYRVVFLNRKTGDRVKFDVRGFNQYQALRPAKEKLVQVSEDWGTSLPDWIHYSTAEAL